MLPNKRGKRLTISQIIFLQAFLFQTLAEDLACGMGHGHMTEKKQMKRGWKNRDQAVNRNRMGKRGMVSPFASLE